MITANHAFDDNKLFVRSACKLVVVALKSILLQATIRFIITSIEQKLQFLPGTLLT